MSCVILLLSLDPYDTECLRSKHIVSNEVPASARGRVNPINWVYTFILKMKVIKCDWAESMQWASTYKY
jgi:hypothetical protein